MAMNGLDKITDKILAEAKAESDAILRAAEEECAKMRTTYEASAEEIRRALTAEAEREGADIVSRAKAASVTQKSSAQLRQRTKLIDEAFDAAYQSVLRQEPEKYTEMLTGLLCSALRAELATEQNVKALGDTEDYTVPECYEVLMSAKDRDRFGRTVLENTKRKMGVELSAEVARKLMLSDKEVRIDGGLILRCGDVECNCSLSVLFAQLRRELEGEVARALFDEGRRA